MTKEIEAIYRSLQKDSKVSNIHAVPRVKAVVVNVGVGKQKDDEQFLKAVREDIAKITGQVPQERKARKAISGFKIRKGNVVGYRVTLRGKRRDDFIQRFVHVTLPRVRDFRGIRVESIDQQGNLHVGLEEHLAFPEIHPDKTDIIFGLQVTFITTARNSKEAEIMLRALGFPLVAGSEGESTYDVRTSAERAKIGKKEKA